MKRKRRIWCLLFCLLLSACAPLQGLEENRYDQALPEDFLFSIQMQGAREVSVDSSVDGLSKDIVQTFYEDVVALDIFSYPSVLYGEEEGQSISCELMAQIGEQVVFILFEDMQSPLGEPQVALHDAIMTVVDAMNKPK